MQLGLSAGDQRKYKNNGEFDTVVVHVEESEGLLEFRNLLLAELDSHGDSSFEKTMEARRLRARFSVSGLVARDKEAMLRAGLLYGRRAHCLAIGSWTMGLVVLVTWYLILRPSTFYFLIF
jgi:hypothetical protein